MADRPAGARAAGSPRPSGPLCEREAGLAYAPARWLLGACFGGSSAVPRGHCLKQRDVGQGPHVETRMCVGSKIKIGSGLMLYHT